MLQVFLCRLNLRCREGLARVEPAAARHGGVAEQGEEVLEALVGGEVAVRRIREERTVVRGSHKPFAHVQRRLPLLHRHGFFVYALAMVLIRRGEREEREGGTNTHPRGDDNG